MYRARFASSLSPVSPHIVGGHSIVMDAWARGFLMSRIMSLGVISKSFQGRIRNAVRCAVGGSSIVSFHPGADGMDTRS